MLHPLFSQLLVTTRHAELLAEADRRRLAAMATRRERRLPTRSWFPRAGRLRRGSGTPGVRPSAVITGLIVSLLLVACAAGPVAFPPTPAIRSTAPTELSSRQAILP